MDALMLIFLWLEVVPFLVLCAIVTVVAILALVLLLRKSGRSSAGPAFDEKPPFENLSSLHCRHFPQMRQVLSRADENFLVHRITAAEQRKWRANRRRVAREFLRGLHQDFVRLDRLSRTVAALSPEVSRSQEAERIGLGIRFRAAYFLVQVQLALGLLSPREVIHLAEMVGSFAARIEALMTALEQQPASRMGAVSASQ
ncbi:MAG: hypothetical protein ACRD4K_00520 [Candidatus Acidiferrales bacterium]